MKYRRIYHVHIRKTGGTSINKAFISLNSKNCHEHYNNLAVAPNNSLILNKKSYIGWNLDLINKGKYYYAFSHNPYYLIRFRSNTFIFTCLRDPIARVISHFRMVDYFVKNKIVHPCLKREGPWLGNGIIDFVNNMPKSYLLNQLYTFSEEFSYNEAFEKLSNLNYILYFENFKEGLEKLSSVLKIDLKLMHEKKYKHDIKISKNDLDFLHEKLDLEYKLFEKLRNGNII